jgi:hypothetical protein
MAVLPCQDGATSRICFVVGPFICLLSLLVPSWADDRIPSAFAQEVLIKTTLLTFNDANLTGNYTILHAKLAKAFRDKVTEDGLKQAFKVFADQKVDFAPIAAMPPVASRDARINASRGSLELRGSFETKPSRVTYEIDFLLSEGQWKPALIDVRLRPASATQ